LSDARPGGVLRQARGAAVLSELQAQRQVLERSQGALQGASAGLSQAEAALATMARRAKAFFWG
jgi:hypothetical protein